MEALSQTPFSTLVVDFNMAANICHRKLEEVAS